MAVRMQRTGLWDGKLFVKPWMDCFLVLRGQGGEGKLAG